MQLTRLNSEETRKPAAVFALMQKKQSDVEPTAKEIETIEQYERALNF